MKPFLLSIFLLLTTGSYSQDLKKVILRDCGKNISEIYQVRREDISIKEGLYQKFFCFITDTIKDYVINPDAQKQVIKEMGYYKNGKKDSLWTTYSYSNQLNEQGIYKEDIKIGIWEKVKKIANGYMHARYDYINNKPLDPYFQLFTNYPNYAVENEIQGVVRLTYELKKDCSIENIKVLNSVGGGCDEEAIRKTKRLYELMKVYNCKCEEKTKLDEVEFRLD
jgi:hypothetical protein